MKGSYFESPRTGWHAYKVKKHFHCLKMHLFLPYLLNDSQTIRSTLHFSKPLLCVTLICCDWSHFHVITPVMPDKAVFVMLCVQCYRGNRYFNSPKGHLLAKNEFAFSFRPTRKDQQVGSNMLMFHVDLNTKRLGLVLITTGFNDSESTLSFEIQ